MRTLVEIPDEYVQAIDLICIKEKISRAEAIRRAVISFANQKAILDFDSAVGSWKDLAIDGLAFQRNIREDRE